MKNSNIKIFSLKQSGCGNTFSQIPDLNFSEFIGPQLKIIKIN